MTKNIYQIYINPIRTYILPLVSLHTLTTTSMSSPTRTTGAIRKAIMEGVAQLQLERELFSQIKDIVEQATSAKKPSDTTITIGTIRKAILEGIATLQLPEHIFEIIKGIMKQATSAKKPNKK